MTKVFVCSTVFDLIDIRSEIESQLREMGLNPLRSDSSTSEFEVNPDRNSIETCLINVENSDVVLVILSQRYGPKLGNFDYDDVSATHLEYRHAKEHNKEIFFYVRDRLESDFRTWKKNNDQKVELPWIDEKDYGLFGLLKERQQLDAKKNDGNWYDTFGDSQELKRLVARDLHLTAGRAELKRLISAGDVPMIDVTMAERKQLPKALLHFTLTFTNVGGGPAFELTRTIKKIGRTVNDALTIPVIASGQSHMESFVSKRTIGQTDACAKDNRRVPRRAGAPYQRHARSVRSSSPIWRVQRKLLISQQRIRSRQAQ